MKIQTIPIIGKRLNKSLRRGQIKFSHAENGSLIWAAKNKAGVVRYFDVASPFPGKIVQRFVKSISQLY